ncbi:MAG: glycosyltransferase family 4 protein [Candidatus Solibacter sp.]|nr:glycosyltransferase family 4 protein [Candidatus Solibacter sp.]
MRVLLTNHALAARAGTELYVRDLAIELMRRGHQPVCYSTRLGAVAEEIRAATVPVVRSLECLGEAPDIIHGHHHYETLTAMLRFPQTPAISYCHGWFPSEEAALRFPRIFRYVAVSEVCRERLIAEGGIAPEQIELIFNFFDARLFPPRGPVPAVPRRALAFCNSFHEQNGLPVLREACRRCGIELESVGQLAPGGAEERPGALLARQDIVFARGRAAIEAMGVGSAVVLAEPERLGPMVTSREFGALRRRNFALRALTRPLCVEAVVEELRRYDPQDAAAVSRTVREDCGLQGAVDRIVSLYECVLAEARRDPPGPSVEGDRAAARYLADKAVENMRRCLEVERELAAMRASATWQLAQGVMWNPLVQFVFGRFIRSVAQRAQRRSGGLR